MKYGLIGEKLGHSFSKEVHSLIAGYEYEIREISKCELSSFMLKKDFTAINVTIPYKEAVIPYLDYVSDEAKMIGAVNTVVNKGGKLYGYNTDFYGMCALLRYADIDVKEKKAVILGSGGTAKTARAVLSHLGASEIVTVGRTEKDGIITYGELYSRHTDAEILINTTPVGMYPSNQSCPVDLSTFPKLSGLIDAIYNPLRTKLVLSAREKSIKAEGGLYMLVAQAVYASEIFSEIKYGAQVLNDVYSKIKAQKENVVLIGMPSSGKSTVGAILSKSLSRELADTDELIKNRAKSEIPDLFKKVGENGFRDIESEVIANISLQNGIIIATGGGAILRAENVKLLKQNGKLFFLNRSLENLTPTADRPLSRSRDEIEKRHGERYGIYLASADITVDGDRTPQEVAEQIIGEFYK